VITKHDAFTVRQAGIEEAELLASLAAALFEQTFGAANDAEDMRVYLATSFSAELQRAELADNERFTWIVRDRDSNAIGYAMLRRGTRGPGVSGQTPVEVQRIYVDRRWHGRSVANALMQCCVEQALAWGADVLWLAVWEENPRAIAFYERSGFRKVGVQTFTLGRDVQHDFVMLRRLP